LSYADAAEQIRHAADITPLARLPEVRTPSFRLMPRELHFDLSSQSFLVIADEPFQPSRGHVSRTADERRHQLITFEAISSLRYFHVIVSFIAEASFAAISQLD